MQEEEAEGVVWHDGHAWCPNCKEGIGCDRHGQPFAHVCRDDFPAARRDVVVALSQLTGVFDSLAEELNPVSATPDQAIQCALLVEEIGRAAGYARKVLTDAVLEWFAKNEGGLRELEAGPEKLFWPDRSPGPALVKDHSMLGMSLWEKTIGESVMAVVYGDEDAALQVRELFRELIESAMSKTGWKPGKVKEILGEDGYWAHYDRPSLDKMKTGKVAKLGMANQRFFKKRRRGA